MKNYKELKNELNSILKSLAEQKQNLESQAEKERKFLNLQKQSLDSLRFGIDEITKQRQIGYPWLADAFAEAIRLTTEPLSYNLSHKKYPALKASEVVKEQINLRAAAERKSKIIEGILKYYEMMFPHLKDLREELEIDEECPEYTGYTEEETQDKATNYLTPEEYRKLSNTERNQRALDGYKKRKLSNLEIGRMYERYIGSIYETMGYDVSYIGILDGVEDLGRDLICIKGSDKILIQCKNWASFKNIYENHIFQFFGTVFKYKNDLLNDKHRKKSNINSFDDIKGIFYTTTSLSDFARSAAEYLNIEVKENFKMDKDYPCIKCNISDLTGEKIYHLPFDQQYDRVKIEPKKGEFYCQNIKEAEDKGFRRAFRYKKFD